jgi:poly(3-hydroxybutyrate) depolymerase
MGGGPGTPPGGRPAPRPKGGDDKKEGKKADKKEEKKEDAKEEKKEEKKAETGFFMRSNAARDHEYWLFVPEDYDKNISYALLIWLHPAGKGKEDDFKAFKEAWEDYCLENHIIIAAPKAENDTGWLGSEAEFVQEVANQVIGEYTIDRRRIVAHGMGVGGQLAFRLGFRARDLVRGVATTGAVMADVPKDSAGNDALSFFIVAGEKDPIAKAIADSKDKLVERKFPVIFHEIPNMGHQYLTSETLDELARWIDSLDNL